MVFRKNYENIWEIECFQIESYIIKVIDANAKIDTQGTFNKYNFRMKM